MDRGVDWVYKGIIHAHSTYSDGEFTLAQLREILLRNDCSFVCMSDHAEYFDAEKMSVYVKECDEHSDDKFLFIPGLEFTCQQRMHVLAYGTTKLTDSDDPQDVIAHIKRSGGVAIIAHPMDSAFPWIESFKELPRGIETWNSKYDGQYAPRPGTFALLQRLREREPEMIAAYGVDLHWKKQFRQLYTNLQCESLSRDTAINSLMSGQYFGLKDDIKLPADGTLSDDLLSRFGTINRRSMRFRSFTKRIKKTADRFGAKIPEPVKGQLRRIF